MAAQRKQKMDTFLPPLFLHPPAPQTVVEWNKINQKFENFNMDVLESNQLIEQCSK